MRDYSRKNKAKSSQIRTDASSNKEALIQAAYSLFVEKGPDVSVTEIVNKAEVSRPTFYRNFPDRHSLVMAVFHYNLDNLEEYAYSIEGQEKEFMKLLEQVVIIQDKFHAMISFLNGDENELMKRLVMIFSSSVSKAKEEGFLRSDFIIENDLSLVIMMLGNTLSYQSESNKKQIIERALNLIVHGIQG